jgi:putative pyruvate formate lyase activating enzyme
MTASYRNLLESGELDHRVRAARRRLAACDICPWECGVDRLAGELGVCQTGARARISSFGLHRGEEGPISGSQGSGTVFFSCCNLACVFCQNPDVSGAGFGQEAATPELAQIMLDLQGRGAHNINLVSPSHVVPQILEALALAAGDGLALPLVYNTGGYDALETLGLLDGVVDIYMPDMKYGDEAVARKYSGVRDYPAVNQAAILEMHRQVGPLQVDGEGVAVRGLLVRHLVLPGGLAGSEAVLTFLAREVSPETHVNIMPQYWPAFRAREHPRLARRIQPNEHRQAEGLAKDLGLKIVD